MEKKHYIMPSLNVVKVQLTPLMEGSTPLLDTTESFSDESGIGSRLWDDNLMFE